MQVLFVAFVYSWLIYAYLRICLVSGQLTFKIKFVWKSDICDIEFGFVKYLRQGY